MSIDDDQTLPLLQSATSTIRQIRTESIERKLKSKSTDVTRAIRESRTLLNMIKNDVRGGGLWSTNAGLLCDAAEAFILEGEKSFASSRSTSHQASSCAATCLEEECAACSPLVLNSDPGSGSSPSLDTLVAQARQEFTSSHDFFLKTNEKVETCKIGLLSVSDLGDILQLARRSAASACGELQRWLRVLSDTTRSLEDDEQEVSKLVVVEEEGVAKDKSERRKKISKKERKFVEERKKFVADSSSLRGSSEEEKKTKVSSRVRLELQRRETERKNPSQCEQIHRCRSGSGGQGGNEKETRGKKEKQQPGGMMEGGDMDEMPEMERDGCVHGCSSSLQEAVHDGECEKPCKEALQDLLRDDADVMDDMMEKQFLKGCLRSCGGGGGGGGGDDDDGGGGGSKMVLGRHDQLGDVVVIPHGSATGIKGDINDVRLDDVPLKRGHGFRCNETSKWKPCHDSCERVHGIRKSWRRSGCVYGCRIVILKSLPSENDCSQYCDEVVGQVMARTDLYGNESLLVSSAELSGGLRGGDGVVTKREKERMWSTTCGDSCVSTFLMRAKAGFDAPSKGGKDLC